MRSIVRDPRILLDSSWGPCNFVGPSLLWGVFVLTDSSLKNICLHMKIVLWHGVIVKLRTQQWCEPHSLGLTTLILMTQTQHLSEIFNFNSTLMCLISQDFIVITIEISDFHKFQWIFHVIFLCVICLGTTSHALSKGRKYSVVPHYFEYKVPSILRLNFFNVI